MHKANLGWKVATRWHFLTKVSVDARQGECPKKRVPPTLLGHGFLDQPRPRAAHCYLTIFNCTLNL